MCFDLQYGRFVELRENYERFGVALGSASGHLLSHTLDCGVHANVWWRRPPEANREAKNNLSTTLLPSLKVCWIELSVAFII